MFFGQLNAFVPLYLPRLGIAPSEVAKWTGAIASVSSAVGLPFLPLWGALADRYARQPVIVRAFVVHLFAAVIMLLAGNVWVFAISFTVLSNSAPSQVRGRVMSFAYLPVNVGFIMGPAIGSVVTRASLSAVFPTAAVLTALGIGVLRIASHHGKG